MTDTKKITPVIVTQWKDKFTLGLEKIDKQHKQFFTICAQLVDTTQKDVPRKTLLHESIKFLMNLRTYAFLHFYTEEIFMRKYHYPEIMTHMNAHDMYIKRIVTTISEFQALAADGKVKRSALVEKINEANEYAVNWWSEHILKVDQLYASYIKKKFRI